MYRSPDADLEVFLVHPGGPFWAKKDDGAWSIPKGEYEEGEDTLDAARREFFEETGFTAKGVLSGAGHDQAGRRKDRYRMGIRGKLRSAAAEKQFVSDRMASAVEASD